MTAREVAALVPMPHLLEALGFIVNERTRRCACLIHGGSNRSAFSWTDAGWWKCHSCDAGGDRIALVRAVRQCSFREAVKFLATLAGVSVTDGEFSSSQYRRIRGERDADLAAARLLVSAEHSALRETRENLGALNDLQRKVSTRVRELENGRAERWPGETDWAWEALRFVCEAMPGADAAYCIATFSAPVERAAFALHPEQRDAIIQAVLERGYVSDAEGHRFEVGL